jgi:hypothetical protein
MSIDFSVRKPWAGITKVTVDGQTMVKIPKFYVRKYTPTSGSYKDKPCWEIANNKADGFHVHPAFMHNGVEIDYFYIGAYEASQDASNSAKAASLTGMAPWVNITYDNAIKACTARNTGASGSEQYGWHMQNVWERSAVTLLALVELGSPDVQTKIGAGNVSNNAAVVTGSSNAVYRDMHELWGNVWDFVDGFRGGGVTTSARVFDNQGNQTYINTGATLSTTDGWVKDILTATGTNFDLNDGFFPSSVDSTQANGTFSDCYWCPHSLEYVAYIGGYWSYGASCGLFCWHLGRCSTDSGTYVSFRVAKWDI